MLTKTRIISSITKKYVAVSLQNAPAVSNGFWEFSAPPLMPKMRHPENAESPKVAKMHDPKKVGYQKVEKICPPENIRHPKIAKMCHPKNVTHPKVAKMCHPKNVGHPKVEKKCHPENVGRCGMQRRGGSALANPPLVPMSPHGNRFQNTEILQKRIFWIDSTIMKAQVSIVRDNLAMPNHTFAADHMNLRISRDILGDDIFWSME